DLPDLFDAERPDLRVLTLEPKPVDRNPGEMALRPLGEHGHARDELGARLEVRELLAVATTALVAGADAADSAVGHEQLLSRGLGQDHRPACLRLLPEPAAELRERG